MNRFTAVASFFVVAQAFAAEPSGSTKVEPKAAFERMKSLAGEWQGKASHGDKSFPGTVTYKLASNGTVVMETLMPGTPHEMISMYYLDGGDLVMTHYCGIGNQPRMKLDTAASTKDELKFAFVGGSNLDPSKDAHIHAGALKFDGAGLVSDWTFWDGGKEQGHNVFNLKRVSAPETKPAAAPQAKH